MECLFPLENVLLIRRIHHYQFKTAYFNHCSTIMIIEQWMFCRMSQQHYYDTGHKIITVISEYPCYSHLSPAFGCGVVMTCFRNLGLWRLGIENPILRKYFERFCHYRKVSMQE